MSTPVAETPSEARERRIADLEQRLSRRGPGVRAPVAVLGILTSVALLWMQGADLRYFYSSREPLLLGREGHYDLAAVQSNRYVEVHGLPTSRGAYAREGDTTYVVLGLRESPFLVRRGALPEESWEQGRLPPPPHQAPFTVRGRLLSQAQATRYPDAFTKLRTMEGVQPYRGQLWLILAGQKPGSDIGLLISSGALLSFGLVNLWLLTQSLKKKAPLS